MVLKSCLFGLPASIYLATHLLPSNLVSKTFTLQSDRPQQTAAVERRHEERLDVNIPGEIKAIGKAGRLFAEEIIIEDWNEEGCRFESAMALKAGDIVAIRPRISGMEEQNPGLYEIVWASRKIAFWVAGAIKVPQEKLASINSLLANLTIRRSPK